MNRAMNGKQMMKCGGKAHGKKYKSGGKVDSVSGADKYSAKAAHKDAIKRYEKAMGGKSMAEHVADGLNKKGISTSKSKDGKVIKVEGKKNYKSGGKVRGCGVAKRGTKKAKMY